MQTTQLAETLSHTLMNTNRFSLKLVIANKKYSSWSMRPWVAMTAFGISFEEIRIPLGQLDTADRIAQYSAAGRVPILLSGEAGKEITIWDSLAICEYLAEQFPEKKMWPQNMAARTMARCICAEMHASFSGVRTAMSMNIGAQFPGKGRTAESQADIGRLSEIWEDCLSRFGHHQFLFGDFSIADAYFAPVVMRFSTYAVSLAPALQAYADRVMSHPAVAQWVAEALLETERLEKYDISA